MVGSGTRRSSRAAAIPPPLYSTRARRSPTRRSAITAATSSSQHRSGSQVKLGTSALPAWKEMHCTAAVCLSRLSLSAVEQLLFARHRNAEVLCLQPRGSRRGIDLLGVCSQKQWATGEQIGTSVQTTRAESIRPRRGAASLLRRWRWVQPLPPLRVALTPGAGTRRWWRSSRPAGSKQVASARSESRAECRSCIGGRRVVAAAAAAAAAQAHHGVGQVRGKGLQGGLAGRGVLGGEAQAGKHGQAAVLDLLGAQLLHVALALKHGGSGAIFFIRSAFRALPGL